MHLHLWHLADTPIQIDFQCDHFAQVGEGSVGSLAQALLLRLEDRRVGQEGRRLGMSLVATYH